MDQTSSANVKTPPAGGSTSQLFGSNFKKDNLDKRVQELLRQSTEYHELKQYIINRGVNKIQSEGVIGRFVTGYTCCNRVTAFNFYRCIKCSFFGKDRPAACKFGFPWPGGFKYAG